MTEREFLSKLPDWLKRIHYITSENKVTGKWTLLSTSHISVSLYEGYYYQIDTVRWMALGNTVEGFHKALRHAKFCSPVCSGAVFVKLPGQLHIFRERSLDRLVKQYPKLKYYELARLGL